ncbi:MAG: helix-turn-helix domain-containing protein [Myxococcota bacterium]
MSQLSPFGIQLRAWRRRRGLSQLDLALHAGTTPRYVSFVETGRSRPGRDLIVRLCDALDVPLRDRNVLLAAAGLSPSYPERTLDDDALAPVHRVVSHLLTHHEPFPAWVMGKATCLRANPAANRLFPGLVGTPPEDLIERFFRPGPLREMIENWREVAHLALGDLRSETLRNPTPERYAALAKAEAMATSIGPTPEAWSEAVACPIFRIDGQRVRTIASVLRFDNAVDVTVAELRVELMFPADDASEAFFRAHARVTP